MDAYGFNIPSLFQQLHPEARKHFIFTEEIYPDIFINEDKGQKFRDIKNGAETSMLEGIYARMDLYMSMARAEGFGFPIAEAMVRGIPTIVNGYATPLEIISKSTPEMAVPIIASRDLNKARLISKTIEDMGHEIVSEWVTHVDPGFTTTAQEVFKRDVSAVKACDVLVAEVSDRSHGVGMEIMQAHISGKNILCLLKRGTAVSRMILGLPRVILIEYSSEEEMIRRLKASFDK